MRTFLIITATFLVAIAFLGCGKKVEEGTAETAEVSMTVDAAKTKFRGILEDIDNFMETTDEPTPATVTGLQGYADELASLKDEIGAVEPPEAEAGSYEEAAAKVGLAHDGLKGIITLSELALAEEPPEMTKDEIDELALTAQKNFIEACEYAAPEIAEKLKEDMPPEEPTE